MQALSRVMLASSNEVRTKVHSNCSRKRSPLKRLTFTESTHTENLLRPLSAHTRDTAQASVQGLWYSPSLVGRASRSEALQKHLSSTRPVFPIYRLLSPRAPMGRTYPQVQAPFSLVLVPESSLLTQKSGPEPTVPRYFKYETGQHVWKAICKLQSNMQALTPMVCICLRHSGSSLTTDQQTLKRKRQYLNSECTWSCFS